MRSHTFVVVYMQDIGKKLTFSDFFSSFLNFIKKREIVRLKKKINEFRDREGYIYAFQVAIFFINETENNKCKNIYNKRQNISGVSGDYSVYEKQT